MPAIEGYRFSVNLDDHGMSAKLTTLSREASALQRIMHAFTNESMSTGNTFAALSNKIEYSGKAMQAYQNVINAARRDMQDMPQHIESVRQKLHDLDTTTDEGKQKAEEYRKEISSEENAQLRLVNRIENARNSIARLTRQQQQAAQQLRVYNGVLQQSRTINQGMSSGMRSYTQLLQQEGLASYTTGGKVKFLTEQHRLARQQYSLELDQTKRLQAQIPRLSRSYEQESNTMNKLKSELNQAKQAQQTAADVFGKASTKYADASKNVARLNDAYSRSKLATSGFRSAINSTTSELQKQSARTTQAASQMLKLRSSIDSVRPGPLGSVSRALGNVSAQARAATSHTRAWASGMRGSLMGVTATFGLFSAGIGKSVSMAASLQKQWVDTKNILQTGAKSAAEARKEVGQMGTMERDAANYSKTYGFSQKEIANQYTELVKRGYTARQSIGSMKSMLEASRASGDDYADVVKNVSSTLDAFNLRQGDVVKNSNRVTNAMAYAADMTATDFKGMGEAMSYVSASAHQAGQSVESTTAAVGELSNAGIEGTRAGTGLRKMLNSLTAPTNAAKEALKKYGMSMDDFKTKSGALKQLPQIMETINKHTKDLGKSDKAAFFKAVFGTTGQQAAMTLAQDAKAMDELAKKEKEAEKHNYVENLAKKNMQSTQMQLKILRQQISAIAIDLGSVLLPVVNKVIQAFSKWAGSKEGKAQMKEFEQSVRAVGNAVADHAGSIISFLGGFAEGLMDVGRVVGKAVEGIASLVGWIGKFTGHSGEVSHMFGIITGGIVGVVAVLKILHGAISGINALRQDVNSLRSMHETRDAIQEQDDLYQKMIDLQQQSIQLAKEQAQQQQANADDLANSVNSAEDTSATPTPEVKEGSTEVKEGSAEVKEGATLSRSASKSLEEGAARSIESGAAKGLSAGALVTVAATAGTKSGTSFLGGFLRTARTLPRRIFGLFLPSAALDAGSKMGTALMRGIVSKASAAGKLFMEAFSRKLSAVKNLGSRIISNEVFVNLRKNASELGKEFVDSFRGPLSKIGGFMGRYLVPETLKNIGKKAASVFARGFRSLGTLLHPSQWFKGVEPAAKAAGEAGGKSLLTRLGSVAKSARIGVLGKSLAKGLADPIMLVFTALDLFKALKHSNSENRARRVGGALGSNIGMMAGAKAGGTLGASLGSFAGPIGSVAGGIIGAVLGGVIGSKVGKSFGSAMGAAAHGAAKTMELIFVKHDWSAAWSNLKKSWQNFWSGMANWWDKLWGKKTKETANKQKNTFKAGTNVQYSKQDVANLHSMTRAIDEYKRAMSGLKNAIKKNDPSKEMNSMINHLKSTTSRLSSVTKELKKTDKQFESSSKSWKKFAVQVKALGKAFQNFDKQIKPLTNKKNGLSELQKNFKELDKTLSKQRIGKGLDQISKEIKKSKIDKQLASIDKSLKTSVKNWKALDKPLLSAAKAFQTLGKAMRSMTSGKTDAFTKLSKEIQTFAKTLKKYPFGTLISKQAKIANDAMGNKHTNFAAVFTRDTNEMTRSLRSFGRTFKRDWENTWDDVSKPVASGMNAATRHAETAFNRINAHRSSFQSAFLKGWNSWIDSVVKNFHSGFNKLPGYAESSMRDIVSRLNRGINGVNRVISDFGGDKQLSSISYANGAGAGHPGGHMIVNDSTRPDWKELVKFPGKEWMIFKDRNVFIPNAPQGTQVINGEETKRVMSAAGIHHYADGTLSEDQQDEIAEEFMDNPKAASKKLILQLTNWNSKVPVVADLGKAMAIGFSQGIANVLKDLLGIIKEPINGDWTPVIKSAFRVLHLHAQGWQIAKFLRQIQTESGGSETIIGGTDGLSDGHATGLLQFKPGTFAYWADPRYSNIMKGFDQIVAAIRCLNAGGEGGWGNFGMGHGWSQGGFVYNEQIAPIAEGNLPEAIIPLDINKRPRAQMILQETVDRMDRDGGGSGLNSTKTDKTSLRELRNIERRFDMALNQNQELIALIDQLIGATNAANDPAARYRRTQHDINIQHVQSFNY